MTDGGTFDIAHGMLMKVMTRKANLYKGSYDIKDDKSRKYGLPSHT